MSFKVSRIKRTKPKVYEFLQYRIWGQYPDGTWIGGKPEGIKKKAHLTSQTAMERWCEQHERELYKQWETDRQQAHQSPTVRALWDEFLVWSQAKRNEQGTIDWKKNVYETRIEPVLGQSTRIDKIDATDKQTKIDPITKLRLSLADLKPKSANNVLGLLRSMLLLAHRRGKLGRVPEIEPFQVPKAQPKFLPQDEREKLLEAGRELDAERVWQPLAVILLGSESGLRRGEILALSWSDLDFEGLTVTVRSSWTKHGVKSTKSNRDRIATLSEEAAALLKRNRHLRGPFVFYQKKGKPPRPASPKTLYNWLELACERAKIPKRRAHALRHTFGSVLARGGASAFDIQEQLGHSDLRTTEIYTRLAAQSAKRTREILKAAKKANSANTLSSGSEAATSGQKRS